MIPVAKHEAVRKAFEGAFGTVEIEDIEPLTGGRSAALVYKVTVNRRAYVMRLVLQTDALTDPVRQFICLNAAAKAGIAPAVHYTSADDAVSIVDFIEHSPVREQFPADEALFGALAASIKSIHTLPRFPKLVDFLDGVDGLIERYKAVAPLPEAVTRDYFRRYAAIQRIYPRHEEDLVASHNDLNPGNVLQNGGRLWIIDWEVAFANDRYADLAIVNIFFGAGERGEDALLRAYFGESLTDYHRARYFLMRQVCFMYYSMVFMYLASSTRRPETVFSGDLETMRLHEFHTGLRSGEVSMDSPEDHLMYGKILLNESLAQMKTARFEEALKMLGEKKF